MRLKAFFLQQRRVHRSERVPPPRMSANGTATLVIGWA
jgi:hypothetical protein